MLCVLIFFNINELDRGTFCYQDVMLVVVVEVGA